MKLRNTLLLLILCVGLFAYIKLYDSKKLSTDELREKKGKVVEVDRDSVDAVTIRNSESTIELKKNQDGNWLIESPVKDRADSLALSTLLTSLEGLRMEPVPAGKGTEALAEYGLTKGDASIKVAGKKPFELLIGKETAVEGRVYMRVDGKEVAYVAPKDLRDQASKGLKDWRDRKLSDLTATQVNKVIVKTAKGEVEADKTASRWSLTRPFKARADDQKITDLISNATTQRVEDFLPDTKDLGAFGLNEPRATVTFHAEGVKEPVVLKIGNPKPAAKPEEKKEGDKPEPPAPAAPTHVYVELSNRSGVMTVPVAIESLLNTQPQDLRDQNLMRVQTDMVDRITIEAPGHEKIVLGRNGEEWVRKVDKQKDSPVNGGAANKLLSDLTTMKASRFVADVAGDLKQYGLDAPQATVTLSSYSTEGTPETKPGDRPLAKLLLGKFEGDAGYAKLDDEPFIVAVPSSLLEVIWTDPLKWQELKIQDLKSEDIAAIEITRTGQPALALQRGKDKGWKLAKGDGVLNQSAVDSLVNTLANLRAVRWAGATVATAQGLEKPNLVINFTLADKKAGKLTIGGNTADESWYATLEGRTGTFLLSRPDFDALNGSLIETPKAAGTVGAPVMPPVSSPAPQPSAVIPPSAPEAPPVSPAPPKPVEAPAGGTKPAPESAPKP
jgi:hypothetical protein